MSEIIGNVDKKSVNFLKDTIVNDLVLWTLKTQILRLIGNLLK